MSLDEIIKKDYVLDEQSLCFPTTPLLKVWILSLLFGFIYHIILVYGYWKTLREKFGHDILPLERAIFSPIMNFSLFPTLKKYFEHYEIKFPSCILLAFFHVFCLAMMSFLSNNSNWKLVIASYIPLIFATLIISSIQKNINKINEENYPNAQKNNWRVLNIIWVIIFIILYYIKIFIDIR